MYLVHISLSPPLKTWSLWLSWLGPGQSRDSERTNQGLPSWVTGKGGCFSWTKWKRCRENLSKRDLSLGISMGRAWNQGDWTFQLREQCVGHFLPLLMVWSFSWAGFLWTTKATIVNSAQEWWWLDLCYISHWPLPWRLCNFTPSPRHPCPQL